MAAPARDQTARVIRPDQEAPADIRPVGPSSENESRQHPSEKAPASRKTIDIPGIDKGIDKAKAAAAAAGEKLKGNPKGKLIVG
ncbi:MAG: hypothetical protein NTZ72_15850, partial [Afipia sp.]|nr:hypothetical protein [Afipia sp.]